MKSYNHLPKTFKASFFTFIICLLASTSVVAQLSRTESKIIKKAQAYNDESIAFLEQIVNINSGTLNQTGVKQVGMLLAEEFKAIDFNTQWIEMPEEMNRAGHLFASTEGKKGKKLLLIGHLDTVFEADSPFQKFEIRDGVVYGPGANDMKGGNVVMLYALKVLKDLNLLKDASITVAYTGDEESTGKPLSISRKDLVEAAQKSDVALGFEKKPSATSLF